MFKEQKKVAITRWENIQTVLSKYKFDSFLEIQDDEEKKVCSIAFKNFHKLMEKFKLPPLGETLIPFMTFDYGVEERWRLGSSYQYRYAPIVIPSPENGLSWGFAPNMFTNDELVDFFEKLAADTFRELPLIECPENKNLIAKKVFLDVSTKVQGNLSQNENPYSLVCEEIAPEEMVILWRIKNGRQLQLSEALQIVKNDGFELPYNMAVALINSFED